MRKVVQFAHFIYETRQYRLFDEEWSVGLKKCRQLLCETFVNAAVEVAVRSANGA
jgi:hypothetical protein